MSLLKAASWVFIVAGAVCARADTQWSEVAPGISYREYALDGPVRVFVARADRSKKNWTIDSMTSLGTVKGGRETVPDMAVRYDDTVTFDGRRYDVKVAINGDYFDMRTGVAAGGQVISGWFVKRFGEYSGNSGFVWTLDGKGFLGGNVRNDASLQRVVFADRSDMRIDKLNEPRGTDELALYTPHYADNTGTGDDGVEVLVQVSAPIAIMPPSPGIKCQVAQVRENSGSTPLPFDHVVLSANGRAARELRKQAKAGDSLHIDLRLREFGNEDIGLAPCNWTNAYASVGGPKCVLVNGKVPRDWEAKAARYAAEGRKHGSVIKDPRTAVAFDDRYVYFLVVDGRSPESIGMTFTEVGIFCKDELKATNAILQDGGGSSTLWVDGKVKNNPSGKAGTDAAGVLRPVANGYFMALVLRPELSESLRVGERAVFKNAGLLRLGPGTTYGQAAAVRAGQEVRILPHALNGILAKGNHWWFCGLEGGRGWASEDQLRGR
ncbi:MAG TPA: phosphodiester glycosidase family protein [Phycisphaerae bacterium]|nr:phosphodiester glycosidase family protein [Phycisphaerae bacterium]HRR86195.1 phosphodiester glycosidase family protein [Phycisphaerae bacterium]